ncbi:hypothetical protein B0F90DRAFT_1301070 [Multifurca ochricompacta]|uniref:Calcium-transporting ATPase 2 n=1 Tax=Multifurca ochricompacta TaxID=376703 RepID=A0AAD4M655_9AGAM|nr:hypothetical protein B0F90DRAFT_1301070 [Multifurca ochricompacta]
MASDDRPTSSDRFNSPSSPSDNHSFLSLPPPILRSAPNSLEVSSSPDPHASDASLHPPPSPTLSAHSLGSIRWATSSISRDTNTEDPVGLSSLNIFIPPPHRHHRIDSAGAASSTRRSLTEGCDIEETSSVGFSPAAHSDITCASPSVFHSHSGAGSRPTSAAYFVKNARPFSGYKGVESPRHAALNLYEEADLNADPFLFKPLQLARLVDPKDLETLESMGGVDGLFRHLGTHLTHGLRTAGSLEMEPVPGFPSSRGAHDGDKNLHKPDITISSPTGVPEGLQSTISLGGSSPPLSTEFPEDVYKASLEDRQRIFGHNILPQRPSKSLLLLMWLAFKDKVLVLLSIAAVILLALGLHQDFGTTHPAGEPRVDWIEGVAIIVAILVVVLVGSVNDWQKERQFKALNEKKEDRLVNVIRDGVERQIDVHQLVVGDIALLEPGEIIPCDGVFLSGHNVRCDESGATGESDAIKKLSYEECIALRDRQLAELDPESFGEKGQRSRINFSGLDLLDHTDCFVISGSKVLEGVGSYLVISVGTKSFNGRIMMALRRDSENTPLQLKLNDLAEAIAKIGSIAGGLLFLALLIRYFVQLGTDNPHRTSSEKGIAFVQILIISVTLVVVAVPEGLPLAVTLALAFATKRMTKEQLLVRVLGSCETMANASVVCTDKTGTLTQNEMTVVAGSIGVHAKFTWNRSKNCRRSGTRTRRRSNARDFVIDLAMPDAVLSPQLMALFNEAIAINSTAFEDLDPETDTTTFIGSKTETALLEFAKELGWANYKVTRDAANVIQMIPFSSERKFMACVVRLSDGGHRLYIKGASEMLTRKCTRYVMTHREAASEALRGSDVETAPIGESEAGDISGTIEFYGSQSLRTIALCYRDFCYWPPDGMDMNEVEYDDLATDLTLIAITGIKEPLREGVREAVAECIKAGVPVKMCTRENLHTARSIAKQCGIYTPGGIVMEGPHFRTLSPDALKATVPRLQVLARSSPEDKRILVETLKELGDIVAVTGDGTNDGPALKTAHVGFSMGITGTEVAKEASDIILMDDNFSSIVKAIMWGRCVNDAVRKFLQFQVSTNVSAVVITSATALASPREESALSAVQLLWISIIMDTFAALALATDPASPVLLNRKPDRQTSPLFTVNMIKQIIGQSSYQIAVILIFHFFGSQILGFHHVEDSTLQKHHDTIVQTMIFNAFVFAQIFNSFNSRRLDRKLNIFEGMSNNWYFMAITFIGSMFYPSLHVHN